MRFLSFAREEAVFGAKWESTPQAKSKNVSSSMVTRRGEGVNPGGDLLEGGKLGEGGGAIK